MTPSNYFPPHKIEGQHYRMENPEIEFHGLVGVIEGALLYIREEDGAVHSATPEELYGTLLEIRKAYRRNVANGVIDKMGMVIIPSVGGLALCRAGILKANHFVEKRIYEDEEIITVPSIPLSDPLMNPWQRVDIGISSTIEPNTVITATADGEELK